MTVSTMCPKAAMDEAKYYTKEERIEALKTVIWKLNEFSSRVNEVEIAVLELILRDLEED